MAMNQPETLSAERANEVCLKFFVNNQHLGGCGIKLNQQGRLEPLLVQPD